MGRTERRKPGQRARISHADVVAAALRVYKRRGAKSISIRSVASELEVAPNALYSHIGGRDELIEEILDALLAEVEVPLDSTPWPDALKHMMRSSRSVLVRYGDLTPEFLSRPTRGVNARRLGEAMLRFLSKAGAEGVEAVEALQILLVYTLGFSAQEHPRLVDKRASQRQDVSRGVFSSDPKYPLTRDASDLLSAFPDTDVFDRGLEWIIEGIRRQIG